MNIDVNEIEYCKLNVKYEADADLISSKRDEVISKFKEHKIPGFRPGKATLDAVKSHFKKEIQEELKNELASEAFHAVIFEKNIKPFGRPNFLSVKLDNTKFACEFSMLKKPDFELGSYKGFDIPKSKDILSTDELSAKLIEEIRQRYGESTGYVETDFVQDTDSVIINYQGSIDGQPIEKLNVSGELLTVGKTAVTEFSSNLLGMKMGETREFTLKMPDNLGTEEFAGKTISFSVTLVMGSKIVPAPLDDNLAKKLKLKDFNELQTHANMVASNRVKELTYNYQLDQVSRRLVEEHTFKVPDWLIASESQLNVRNSGGNWETMSDVEKQLFLDKTEKTIKLSLVVDRIRENEPDAQLSDEEVFQIIQKNLEQHSNGRPVAEILQEVTNNGHLPILIGRVKDEYVLDFILKNSNIIE